MLNIDGIMKDILSEANLSSEAAKQLSVLADTLNTTMMHFKV
jgi:hypothetical protein